MSTATESLHVELALLKKEKDEPFSFLLRQAAATLEVQGKVLEGNSQREALLLVRGELQARLVMVDKQLAELGR